MRNADHHVPQAVAGALAALILLLAVFVSTPASAASVPGEPPAAVRAVR